MYKYQTNKKIMAISKTSSLCEDTNNKTKKYFYNFAFVKEINTTLKN